MLHDIDHLGAGPRAFYQQLIDAYAPFVGTEELDELAPNLKKAAETLVDRKLGAADLERLGIQPRHRAALLMALLVKRNPQLLKLSHLESNLADVLRNLTGRREHTNMTEPLRRFFQELDAPPSATSSSLDGADIHAVSFEYEAKQPTFVITGTLPPKQREEPGRLGTVPASPMRVPVATIEQGSKGWSVVRGRSKYDLESLQPQELSQLRQQLSARINDLERRGDRKVKDSLLGALLDAPQKLGLEEKMTKALLEEVTRALQGKIDAELNRLDSLEATLRDALGPDTVQEISPEQMEALVARFGITSRPTGGRTHVETGDDRTEAFLGALMESQSEQHSYKALTYRPAGVRVGGRQGDARGKASIKPGEILDLYGETTSGEQVMLGSILPGRKSKEALKEEISKLLNVPAARPGGPYPRQAKARLR